ncbi:MAG: diguanylate cyclase domain-containing protein [Hyphomicrobiales bacterium]
MTKALATKPIFIKLSVLGVVAVGMILWSLFWLTGRINEIEREATRDLVELMVTETVDRVQASTNDYAFWSLAYEVVEANDVEAIYEHMGSGALESELFDQLIILSQDQEVLHLFDATEQIAAPSQFDVASLQPFLMALANHEPSAHVSVAGVGAVNGVHGAITTAWITPDYVDPSLAENLPILVGIVQFGEDELQAIERMTHGSGYAIRPTVEPLDPPTLALPGPDGAPVAQLVWTPHDLGTMLRTDVLPFILLVCAGIFAICLSAARYFHEQAMMLERAHQVAKTDQLTGLLNRSGLDGVLAKSGVRSAIAAGHVAVLYLDLNDFKALNDTHGHKDGDRALKVTAQRLQGAVRSSDHVVRLGGDEFVCLVVDEDAQAAANLVADRIRETCNHPIRFADHEALLQPSIGVAVGKPGIDWDTLLSQSDAAMYFAKRTKFDGPMLFSKEVMEALRSRDNKAGQAKENVAAAA